MAKQNTTVGFELDLKIPPTVGQLKEQLKGLEEQLDQTTKGTAAYNKALVALGSVKGELQNLDESIEKLNPAKRAEQLGTAMQGVTAAFGIAAGAAGAFGASTEETEKIMLRVQSATALMMGTQQLMDAARAASSLKAVIAIKAQDAATKISTVTTRLFGITAASSWAALALPITAAVAAVAAFGFAIYKLKERFKPVSDFIDGFADRIMKTVRAVGSFLGLMDSSETVAQEKRINQALEANKRRLEIDEAAGKDTAKLRRKILDQELSLLDKGSEEYLAKMQEIAVFNAGQRKKEHEARIKEAEENEKKLAEARAKAKAKAEEQARKEAAAKAAFDKKYGSMEAMAADTGGIDARAAAAREAEFKAVSEHLQRTTQAAIEASNARRQRTEADRAAETEAEAKAAEMRIAIIGQMGQSATQLADLLGKHTSAGKVAAVASATIDAYLSITRILAAPSALPSPFGEIAKGINAAAAGATAFKAVKSILATKVPGGGGGGSMPGMPSMSAPSAPSIRPVQQATGSTVLNARDIKQDKDSLKVHVVETDIRKTSKRVESIEKASKFG